MACNCKKRKPPTGLGKTPPPTEEKQSTEGMTFSMTPAPAKRLTTQLERNAAAARRLR